MDRRKFLIGLGIALVAGPAALSLNGCGKSNNDNTPAAPANSFSVTSNPDNTGHSHNVAVLLADLTAPPSGGVTYTSDGATHVHQITLTQQQLTEINNGQSDTVRSTVVNNHSHEWTIKKPA
jgi:hypothetical protein